MNNTIETHNLLFSLLHNIRMIGCTIIVIINALG